MSAARVCSWLCVQHVNVCADYVACVCWLCECVCWLCRIVCADYNNIHVLIISHVCADYVTCDELIEKSLTVNTFFSFPLPFFSFSTKGPRERYFPKLLYQPGIYFFTESKNIENSSQTELQRAENHLKITISPEFHQLDLKMHQKHKDFALISGRVGEITTWVISLHVWVPCANNFQYFLILFKK